MASNDLHVVRVSDALATKTLDVVVSGSIGAVESVRFIRALRRLGAEVYPWLSAGGAQFTTEAALSWAAARKALTQFSGAASHIAQHDACVIAPASASIIGKIAQGITDTPTTALIASYLGQDKPVILVPNMHDSLLESPFVAANLQKISTFCTVLDARSEEGKQKFPDPNLLANQLAHILNAKHGKKILLTMGSTQGPIDAVRYISNYSSGALGSCIAVEFYRYGHRLHVVAGPCPRMPGNYSSLQVVNTNEEMLFAAEAIAKDGLDGAIFAASVLDFVPKRQLAGKVKSSSELLVEFQRTPKIIAHFSLPLKFKVGFKLEVDQQAEQKNATVSEYLNKYRLSHLVYNQLQNVSKTNHLAEVFAHAGDAGQILTSKNAIAQHLVLEAARLLT